ncbi:MAG TPA: tetratricopeptide repeat protein [Candidatus Limnocylindrales bacterium]|nr:tetratricopeptide repeat protein [Candidatus Limnocylindrales bacterium]
MTRRLLAFLLLATAAIGQTSPPTFEELSAKAQKAYEADRLDEAAQLYARAVKLRPDWAQGWWALGMVEYERDRYPECRDALTHMVELDAAAAPGWALLGLCEYRTKQYDAAFQHLKKAHMLVPVTQAGGPLLEMADYHLSLLLIRQGAFEVAQELLMRVALKVHTYSDMMKFAAGMASLRMPILPSEVPMNQRDVVTMAGKAFWDLATEVPDQAEADFKSLLSKYPKFPNAHYFYGTYLSARHPEECTPEFLRELSITPDSVPARVQLALRYILDNNLEEALKLAREAVALSPDSVGAQLALAKTLRTKGDNEGALAAYLAAERIDPVSPVIRLYVVNAYRTLGRIEEMRRENAEYERLKAEQANWP